ncbi:MAG: AMP-binding protein [Bacteroidaceae bacterium]|nr:AMP-binding protein [Bacteroidaceae bacterium]
MQLPQSLNQAFADTIRNNWTKNSMSDYGEFTYQYKDVARIIEKLHIMFEAAGIKKGDKIALCGRNQSRWGVAFFATLTYGAVAVPILHEFHPEQVIQILDHSESKMLFVGPQVWKKISELKMPDTLTGIISNEDYKVLFTRDPKLQETRDKLNLLFGEKYPDSFRPDNISYHHDEPEELAVINYTSGTTSNSKGVMIPYRALWSNTQFAYDVMGDKLLPGDSVLSMLPMAHMYGMAFEFMFEFTRGIHINFLTKMPSPVILMKALADIKPCILICVPLIIEKIVRKAVLPKIKDPKVRILMNLPVIGDQIKKKICESMKQAFGGRYYQVVIGGAALNQEIEALLKDVGFNYTIGYGATECAPILAYEDWTKFKQGSCGKAAPRMELKIDSPDPENIPGEILARGMNVMLGYYKNPEATAETLVDGWYHTGDLGIIDAEGNVFIKGRSKNMLLGANGQNIYPEEIEDKLSSLPMVQECVVIQKGEKMYGLVYPDMEQAKKLNLGMNELKAIMEQNRKDLNLQIPAYEQLAGIRIMEHEFEKTPKKSIKRFLYKDAEV